MLMSFINRLRQILNCHSFADEIIKFITWYENQDILIQMSQKIVIKGPINNKPVLVQMMAWCQAMIWTNAGLFNRHIYVSLGLNELTSVWL